MNIGIITFHRAVNYGAALQTYALYSSVKKVISEEDYVFVLDHINEKMKKQYALFILSYNLRFIIRQIVSLPTKIIKESKFKKFVNNKLVLKSTISEEDRMITGSDQVWNLDIMYGDKAYFLDFVKNPLNKNSYAASFGVESIKDEYFDEISRLLRDFNKISVRERQGQQIIKKVINRDVPIVLDPTMLLSQNEWRTASAKDKTRGKYILLYALAGSDALFSFANELSKKTEMKIICVANINAKKERKFRYKNSAGPAEWIELAMNASYIVTDSFHGTAFAINFNKPFFVELSAALSAVSSRIVNLLELFGLMDRLIVGGENENIDQTINYEEVNKVLNENKEKSIQYIKSIVDGTD